MTKTLLLFIHGLGGTRTSTWGQFPALLKQRREFEQHFEIDYFGYPTALLSGLRGNIPKIQHVSAALRSRIDNRYARFESIVLICHSLGGLIARKYLVDELKDRRPIRVKGLILIAVPNNGADLARLADTLSWKHRQAKQLCRSSDLIELLNQDWYSPWGPKGIPTKYILGTQDRIVDRQSGQGAWGNPDTETVFKDHVGIVKPETADDDVIMIVQRFLDAISWRSGPPPVPNGDGSADPSVAADSQRLPQRLAPEIPIVGRDEPLQQLLRAAGEGKVRVASLIGPAGIGKTSLLEEFLKRVKYRNGKPLELQPFIWHFMNQESPYFRTSSLAFFERSLRFYGFTGEPEKLSHRELSDALVTQLHEKESYLIVLDGVETLQFKGGYFRSEPEGMLGNFLQSICTFVRKPDALVLITSRQPLIELGRWATSGEYLETTLGPLGEEEGVKLLERWLKIQGDRDELRAATRDLAGNPACLLWLGKYLEEFHNSQIWQRGSVTVPMSGGSAKWAKAVIESYDKSLEKDERAFLKLLALFGRPMHEKDFGALLQANAKATQPLQDLTEIELNSIYTRLSRRFLLGGHHTPGQEWKEWETHALLRAYYADQFRNQESAEWREAHEILFKHYASQTGTPTNREELAPLYGAISHAVLAGDYLAALQMYRDKIARNWEGFDTEIVGAGSETLLALSAFFKGGSYRHLCGELPGYDRAWLLARVAYCLESLGELQRAVQPREASNQAFQGLYELAAASSYESFERARDVAYGAEELAASQIRLGELVAAERTARMATEWAARTSQSEASCREEYLWPPDVNVEQVPSWLRECSAKSILGSLLYRRGRLNDAQIEFEAAYALHQHQSVHGGRWPLHSEPGVRLCVLKLEMARTTQDLQETLAYAEAMLNWSSQSKSPHATDTIAGLHSFIKSLVLLALRRDLAQADRLQTQALQWIRDSKKRQFLCDLLLGRAAVRCLLGRKTDAYDDLQEVLELSKTCNMRLARADANLLAAHLFLDDGDDDKASDAMKEAREMILPANHSNHYRLRRAELQLLEARYSHHTGAAKKILEQHLTSAYTSFSQINQWRLEAQWQRYRDGQWAFGRDDVQRARV